jgi:hypothetical protein
VISSVAEVASEAALEAVAVDAAGVAEEVVDAEERRVTRNGSPSPNLDVL